MVKSILESMGKFKEWNPNAEEEDDVPFPHLVEVSSPVSRVLECSVSLHQYCCGSGARDPAVFTRKRVG